MTAKLLYITLPNKELAQIIAKTLVEENLVACVNIIGNIESLYNWEGKFTQDNEILMIAKTSKAVEEAAIDRIKELHSYDVPCIISLDISNGNQDFLQWINSSTKR